MKKGEKGWRKDNDNRRGRDKEKKQRRKIKKIKENKSNRVVGYMVLVR